MPGFDHQNASDEMFAMKIAHLKRIRKDESTSHQLDLLKTNNKVLKE